MNPATSAEDKKASENQGGDARLRKIDVQFVSDLLLIRRMVLGRFFLGGCSCSTVAVV